MKAARKKPMASPRKRSRTPLSPAAARSKSHSAAAVPAAAPSSESGPHWTFLTNHAHVLLLLSRSPSLVLREVAVRVGITERAVQRIIADLEECGFIEREKVGRQNQYRIRDDQPLRHPNESHRTIGELMSLINGAGKSFR